MKWFTSDTHFCHEKIAPTRGFDTAEQMNQAQIDGINECVAKRDTLYVLGDLGFPGPELDDIVLRRIKCKDIRLLLGNHDRLNTIQHLFKYVWETREVKVVDQPTWLSHYPHAYWPKSHHGSFHLYGHMHGQREADLDRMMPGRRSMEVSMDRSRVLLQKLRPFAESEIYSYLSAQTQHDCVKFYKDLRGES